MQVPIPWVNSVLHYVFPLFVAIVGLALAWLLCWTSRRDFGQQVEPASPVGSTR